MSYEPHPYAAMFPLLENENFEKLAEDIVANGLLEPIVLYQGLVLDGRNRQAACQKANVQPRYEEFRGGDALAYVISKNLTRRHLTESQRAMIAADIETKKHGGDRKSNDRDAN